MTYSWFIYFNVSCNSIRNYRIIGNNNRWIICTQWQTLYAMVLSIKIIHSIKVDIYSEWLHNTRCVHEWMISHESNPQHQVSRHVLYILVVRCIYLGLYISHRAIIYSWNSYYYQLKLNNWKYLFDYMRK